MVGVLPSEQYRRLAVPRLPALHKGADAWTHRALGVWHRRHQRFLELKRDAEKVDAQGEEIAGLADRALKDRMGLMASDFRRARDLKNGALVLQALSLVREAAFRQTGMRPYVVQIMGALALDRGFLAEMATGEGKTLTAALAGILAGWRGRPCHIITVNDYLAARDQKWFSKLYACAGLSVGHVTSKMPAPDRKDGYAADITYTTGKEVVADFLRDRLLLGSIQQPDRRLIREWVQPTEGTPPGIVMRGMHSAIIDEADSLLIDEAVTPLIICQPRSGDSMVEASKIASVLASTLQRDVDYTVDRKHREIELLDPAFSKLRDVASTLPQVWSGLARRRELVTQALVARELFERDRQYVLHEGKVVIVDEFTGRMMPNRTWREGLHQAVEAKEGLEPSAPTEILARLSFQKYYRGYKRLSGMSGTVSEAASELWQIYRLPVVRIPQNRQCVRSRWPDRMFADGESKLQAIVDEISLVHGQGRPVLVGTRSVAASESLAHRLGACGLSYQVLNAVRHAEEAQIVARAGERGRITIATNMAGRGTDIHLGEGAAAAGGLHVIASEANESNRVDRQLFGRAGRQGSPGSSRLFASLDDDLVKRYVPRAMRDLAARAIRSGDGDKHTGLGRSAIAYSQFISQWTASRQRAGVLRNDTWLEEALSFSGTRVGG